MNTPAHLTEDQFAECAILAPSSQSHAHLAECAHCRQELARFTQSVETFSTATLAWSEAQPTPSLRAAARSSARRPMYAAAGWALATGLVLSVGVPFMWHRDRPAPAAVEPVVQAATEDSADQIAQDNQMMQSVNLAISVNTPSPFTEYRLRDVRHTAARPRPDVKSE